MAAGARPPDVARAQGQAPALVGRWPRRAVAEAVPGQRLAVNIDRQDAAKGRTIAALALAWLRQLVANTIIIGAKKLEQLDDNLTAVGVQFTPEELQQLDVVRKVMPEYPGRMLT